MAQKVQILLEDDIDGSEAVETVNFGLDGASYEIDLNDKHASALRKALETYVEKGRRVTGQGKPRGARRNAGSSGAPGHTPSEIREWAREQGIEVPERGRIPGDVRDKYLAAI